MRVLLIFILQASARIKFQKSAKFYENKMPVYRETENGTA